ncbi:MAG: hypothetical protein J6328_02070 [Bacilli bacterium]|nr:hypothetical protein [Bacilli bacterium]
MNKTSEVLATLIHYNVAVRDTLEYCLRKDAYDANLFKEKKRSVLIEVNEHTPLKDIIDHSGENGANLEKQIREFYEEVYGDNSTILKLAEDGLRVDHAQHLTMYKYILPIHEAVNSMIVGITNDAHAKSIDISDMEALWKADERMYRGVVTLCLTNDLISLFNDFNKAMQDNGGKPSAASNFIGQDIQAVINHLNFVKANGRVTQLDYKEGVEDKVNAFMENVTGRRDLKQGERFPDAIRAVQNSIGDYVRVTEEAFRVLYVPAMQALVAQAQADAKNAAEKPADAPKAEAAPKAAPKAAEGGVDAPLSMGEIDPKTGLPKA